VDHLVDHSALSQTAHRPGPVPKRPWTWRQTWHDLVFLHWPVAASTLRPLVPEPLEIHHYGGRAWVAVTPFWMSGVRLRNWPDLPWLSHFPELNVRTYVTFRGKPGVWFFSLDAGNRLAVTVARRWFHLPYMHARMRVRQVEERVEYCSVRGDGTTFEASYGPIGPPARAEPGSLDHWLTERYCLYAVSPSGALHETEIHHAPWPLQEASATIRRNDMLKVHGIRVTGEAPHVRFARRLDVVVWSLTKVQREDSGA
jgi:hypothetical protein